MGESTGKGVEREHKKKHVFIRVFDFQEL